MKRVWSTLIVCVVLLGVAGCCTANCVRESVGRLKRAAPCKYMESAPILAPPIVTE
jgi:hypothetical protein